MSNHIRFTASSFHLIERPQFFQTSFEFGLYFWPFKAYMAVQVFFKTGFQDSKQDSSLRW